MKKSILFLVLLQSLLIFAQAPQKMTYQSVVRNSANVLLANQVVGVRISILEGTPAAAVYSETHTVTTNANGLFTLEAGGGTPAQGVFADIVWGNGSHYIKSEIDPAGGTNYTLSATKELLSVPYALYASNGITTGVQTFAGAKTFSEGLRVENKPFLPTKLNQSQINSLTDVQEGMIVYNTDTRKLQLFSGVVSDVINDSFTGTFTDELRDFEQTFIAPTTGIITEIQFFVKSDRDPFADVNVDFRDSSGSGIGGAHDFIDFANPGSPEWMNLPVSNINVTAGQTFKFHVDNMGASFGTNSNYSNGSVNAMCCGEANGDDVMFKILITPTNGTNAYWLNMQKDVDAQAGTNVMQTQITTQTATITAMQAQITAQSGLINTINDQIISSLSPPVTIGLHPELGGYVFYVDPYGQHGLVAETQDQGLSNWFNAKSVIDDPANHSVAGQAFTDWRLPTEGELGNMYAQRDNFTFSDSYWSNRSDAPIFVAFSNFNGYLVGNGYAIETTAIISVRGVRAFSITAQTSTIPALQAQIDAQTLSIAAQADAITAQAVTITAFQAQIDAQASTIAAMQAQITSLIPTPTEVVIGTQTWQAKNLNVTTYRDGTPIPEVKDSTAWASLTTGAWCHYNNDPANDAIYGKLYNWYAVNDSRGLAPSGFHVPTDTELTAVTDMKDPAGFAGLPGGYRGTNGAVSSVGGTGFWWSSTESGAPIAWTRYLNYDNGSAYRFSYNKKNGFSVRCLRD